MSSPKDDWIEVPKKSRNSRKSSAILDGLPGGGSPAQNRRIHSSPLAPQRLPPSPSSTTHSRTTSCPISLNNTTPTPAKSSDVSKAGSLHSILALINELKDQSPPPRKISADIKNANSDVDPKPSEKTEPPSKVGHYLERKIYDTVRSDSEISASFRYTKAFQKNRKCLPTQIQCPLLNAICALLKKTFYNFANKYDPAYLQKAGISDPEDIELKYWIDHLCQLSVPADSVITDIEYTGPELKKYIGGQPEGSFGDNHLNMVFWRIADIRHAATHSIKHDIVVIKDMLVDACRIAWSFQDKETFWLLKGTLDTMLGGVLKVDRACEFDEVVLRELKVSVSQLVAATLDEEEKEVVVAQASMKA